MESWKVSDDLWELVKPYIPTPQRDPNREYRRTVGGGREPTDSRKIFEGIIFVLRTGIQWKAIPKEYGSGSTVHRFFEAWLKAGFFHELWTAGLQLYDEFKGIRWAWQSIDGSQRKAPMGEESVGPNPTDRGQNGTKTHVLTDGAGELCSIPQTQEVFQKLAITQNAANDFVVRGDAPWPLGQPQVPRWGRGHPRLKEEITSPGRSQGRPQPPVGILDAAQGL